MRDILPALYEWYAAGSPFGLATVVAVDRSAPATRARPWRSVRATRSWAVCPAAVSRARSSSWPGR